MWYVLVKQCKHRKLHKKLVYFSFFFFFSFLFVFQYFPFGIWPHIYQHICWAWIIIERWTTNQVQVNSGLVKQTSIRRRVLRGKKQTSHESIPIWFKRFILIVDLSLLLLVAPWHKMNAGIYQLFFDNNRFTLQFSNSETEKTRRKSLPRHLVDSQYKSEDIPHSSVREK